MKRVPPTLFLVVMTACAAYASSGESIAGKASGPAAGAPQGYGAPQAYGAPLDINYCYDYLAPYGTWVTLDPYGYVWRPRGMGYGWRPYTGGHWIWSDDGWAWVSRFDWGWIPFHYGRWGFDNDYGWFWVPGTEWGPAWVFWRDSDLYCGWAPIPPGINFGAGVDFDTVALGLPLDFWVFVDGSHFLDRDVGRFCLPYERNASIVRLSRFANHYQFRAGRMIDNGIGVERIRRFTGRPVTRYRLGDAGQPGLPRLSGDRAEFYRPRFRENSEARPRGFLGPEEARRALGGLARIFEAPQRRGPGVPEYSRQPSFERQLGMLQRGQNQERRNLERSQAQERRNIQRNFSQENRGVRNPAERSRIGQEHQSQLAEQQRMFNQERQQMAQRHQQEMQTFRRMGQERGGNPRRK